MQNRIEIFKQMLESDPDNSMVLFGLANEYQKIEDWQKTIETLEIYLAKADDEGAAYGMLAKAYERAGEREKARFKRTRASFDGAGLSNDARFGLLRIIAHISYLCYFIMLLLLKNGNY